MLGKRNPSTTIVHVNFIIEFTEPGFHPKLAVQISIVYSE